MKKARRWGYLAATGLGLMLGGLAGCQTSVGGLTLPSPHYLNHAPQFIPPSPDFPLPQELSNQEAASAAVQGGPGGGALPPPVAPVPPGMPPG